MWGQDFVTFRFALYPGIIPTRVGTRMLCRFHRLSAQDHPHACGDKYPKSQKEKSLAGSSPRVWGQEERKRCYNRKVRIIPTRVGTSGLSEKIETLVQDHPHACGDKRSSGTQRREGTGSSPRVWGQGLISMYNIFITRIIPTRVGTSIRFSVV